ncbi:hypothetical protein OG352_19670 [Streptomyces sp. NBC_01485]|uniref:hypothetical protein n=1 Tax=Streptomyces sp. NBC_01485 TaxID=2903884 RepID=UPI002E35A30E|nr:hypothetical protein [Streptomyces sp. NBC_01485]
MRKISRIAVASLLSLTAGGAMMLGTASSASADSSYDCSSAGQQMAELWNLAQLLDDQGMHEAADLTRMRAESVRFDAIFHGCPVSDG